LHNSRELNKLDQPPKKLQRKKKPPRKKRKNLLKKKKLKNPKKKSLWETCLEIDYEHATFIYKYG